jgi:hypothetical protein
MIINCFYFNRLIDLGSKSNVEELELPNANETKEDLNVSLLYLVFCLLKKI